MYEVRINFQNTSQFVKVPKGYQTDMQGRIGIIRVKFQVK
jgi:hypothetical protein